MNRLIVVAVVLVASSAHAQAPGAEPPPALAPPPVPAPAVTPGPTAPPAATDQIGLTSDANQDHAWYLPTGETVPTGSVVFTDWELLLAGLKWGVAEGVELSAETLVPITSDIPLFVLLGGKLRVLKTDNLRVAINGNLLYARDTGGSSDSFTLGALGGAASLCLDAECHSLLTGGLQLMFGINTQDSSSAFVFTPSVSLIGRLSRHVKALIELDGGGDHVDGKTELGRGALVMYGVRFYSSDIAGDIGFARPICDGCDTGNLVLGLPLVTFSYRFN
jgi:hypothetical protein